MTLKEKADKKRKDRNAPVQDYRIDKVDSGLKSPEAIDQRVRMKTPSVDAPAMPTLATMQNPTGIEKQKRESADLKSLMPTGVTAQSPAGALPTPTGYVNQKTEKKVSSPFSDMLAEQRKSVTKDKTDAVKMQKYYALTDALGAIGKMGGAAVGGAIGGGMIDSAPAVAGYQPSRGYLTAFEEAKRANEKLRALDEKGFQLALRDEERSYKQQQEKLNREWQKQMVDYKNAIDRANADKDFERSRKLKEDFAALEHKHDMELQRLKNQHRASEQAGSRANMQYQYDLYNKPVQIAFDDGTGIQISKNEYEGLYSFLLGKTIGGKTVSKDNFSIVLRENPNIVNDYLKLFGGGAAESEQAASPAKAAAPDAKAQGSKAAPATMAYGLGKDTYNQWRSSMPRNLVEAEPAPIGFDIFAYERK